MWVEEYKGRLRAVERYTDIMTGKQKRVFVYMEKDTPSSRKAATLALQARIDSASELLDKSTITLETASKQYLDALKQEVAVSTYSRNSYAMKTIMGILGKDTILTRLTASYVRQKYLAWKRSPDTKNESMKRFKAFIRWCYRNDMIESAEWLNKIEPFHSRPHKATIQNKYLEPSELEKLLEQCAVKKWNLLIQFMVMTGLRTGEAIALNKSDVDTKNLVIHVTKTYDSQNKAVVPAKSYCSIRDIHIQPDLLKIIHQINIEMLHTQLMNSIPKSKLFMHDDKGDYLSYFAFGKYLKENSMIAIGRSITPHTLRHTSASLMFQEGVPIDVIMRRLGHEDSRVTREIYVHITKAVQEKDNKILDGIKIM